MGLFDFFKKGDQSKKAQADPERQEKPPEGIEVTSVDTGSHGDNFGGLIGFNFLNSDGGGQFVNEFMALSAIKEPVLGNDVVSLHEVRFSEGTGDAQLLGIRTLQFQDQIVSAFPYLETSYTVPFTTKTIVEWSHVGNLEAEIKGGGRETFGFGFFATDYAVNQEKYKANKQLNINVSAIGLVLDKSDVTEIGGQKVSEGFASYMPNQDIPRPTYYDFIGVLIDFAPARVADNNSGYIAKVKLINDEDNPEFFTVDVFFNKENMRFDTLEKGMQISGALWFQGEIA